MTDQKQPYIQNFQGPYALKDIEDWSWKTAFLDAALATHPSFADGRTLARFLVEELRPAWLNAEKAYQAEGDEEEEKDGPGSVSWCVPVLYGRATADEEMRPFDATWYKGLKAWPEIQSVLNKTQELLRVCNLDGYQAETGSTVQIQWTQDVIMETIHKWLKPAWMLRWEYRPDAQGQIPLFPLYLPTDKKNALHAWRDGGIVSPLGWEFCESEPVMAEREATEEERKRWNTERVKTRTVGFGAKRREETFSVTLPIYDPLNDSPAKWRETALRAFQGELVKHIDAVTKTAEALVGRGELTRATKKREREHFGWLALYQVEGVSLHELSARTKKARRTIEEAVGRAAHLIELPLRAPYEPGHGSGRPKGK